MNNVLKSLGVSQAQINRIERQNTYKQYYNTNYDYEEELVLHTRPFEPFIDVMDEEDVLDENYGLYLDY